MVGKEGRGLFPSPSGEGLGMRAFIKIFLRLVIVCNVGRGEKDVKREN
jgi:hypothetical protein